MSASLAGAARIKFPLFLLFDSLGILLWTMLYFALCYYFALKIEVIKPMMDAIRWIGIIVLASIAAFVIWKLVQQRRFLRQLALSRITPEELKGLLDSGADLVIFDLRDPREFMEESRTVAGAVSMTYPYFLQPQRRPGARRLHRVNYTPG